MNTNKLWVAYGYDREDGNLYFASQVQKGGGHTLIREIKQATTFPQEDQPAQRLMYEIIRLMNDSNSFVHHAAAGVYRPGARHHCFIPDRYVYLSGIEIVSHSG